MLYEKKTSAFENFLNDLREQLKKVVSEEELNIVCEYLDITKPRNNALLSRIEKKCRDDFHVSEYSINAIVKKEIIRKDNTELAERFILASYLLFGCANNKFFDSFVDRKCLINDPEKYKSRIIKPISDNLGIDPEVLYYAFRFNNASYHSLPETTKPSVLRSVYEFYDSQYFLNKVFVKAILLCYLLEQEGKNLSEDGKWAVVAAEKLWKEYYDSVLKEYENAANDDEKKSFSRLLAYLTCALGEAAPYSSKACEYFREGYDKVSFNIVEVAINVPNPFVKLFKYIEGDGVASETEKGNVLDKFAKLFKSAKPDDCLVTPEYISSVVYETGSLVYITKRESDSINKEVLPDRDEWTERLAKTYPEQYKSAISLLGDELKLVKYMSEILQRVDPDSATIVEDLRDTSRRKLADVVRRSFSKSIKGNPYCREVAKYILGEATLDDVRPLIDGSWNMEVDGICDYYSAFGIDEYLARAVTVLSLCSYDDSWNRRYYVRKLTGIYLYEHIKETFDILQDCGLSFGETVNIIGLVFGERYSNMKDLMKAVEIISSHPDELIATDFSQLSDGARILAINAMGNDAERFKTKLLSCVNDSSKMVRNELASVLVKQEWHDDIASLLKDKKGAVRELALEVIGRQGANAYANELNAALEVEKSDKIRTYIGVLLDSAPSNTGFSQLDIDKQVSKLAKSAKNSKLRFLFEDTLKTVHKLDGTEATEEPVALVMCYAGMTSPARSVLADSIAANLNQKDLEEFSADIFARWYDDGAQTKFKSALYFCAIHGGQKMVDTLIRNIKEWSEAMRSAIAAETVFALALNGSNEALMNVDNMSRKFKNKRVRAAAVEAMAAAADTLGITSEELADRIVPDLGFDRNLCRVFDYGKRQFNVYLKPSLEMEVFSGDKQIKTLPKPGTTDDKEIAEAAFNEFKEVKKQLKNVVAAQRSRLEYVLMCDRKWTSENWEKLFVGNAVMHCFAVGLIWGIYEKGSLKDTFRYMDDGSFTTADGDEFTLPNDAQIGLVHPLELTEEQIAVWKEQLSDYELTQPFDQLGRMVFRPEDKELPCNSLTRFEDTTVNSVAMINKMTKNGWYKGDAEDAGYFYYFYREDVKSRTLNADGSTTYEGWGSLLVHSGASTVIYDFDGEEVTLKEVVFFKAGHIPNYCGNHDGWVKISDVDPRYFSETMLLLYSLAPRENE
ncbi:MAG: DUF4132 domain-containing protein [Paludibacteraceae bacterium]|nr:DUF4132 domain-containing protein [Paludibacteraceae bacterium]